MEDRDTKTEEVIYTFLTHEKVQQYFADINIELLRGNHMQKDNYYPFTLLVQYKKEFRVYYENLYGLHLIEDKKDSEVFFYLDFPDEGKGKLYHSDRHRELTESLTIIGIMLMNMYYERFFDNDKLITWETLKKSILEGEYAHYYQQLFFNEQRNDFTDEEWDDFRKKMKKWLMNFEALGWVNRKQSEDNELNFELRPAMVRFAKLYKDEIEHFEEFAQKIINQSL